MCPYAKTPREMIAGRFGMFWHSSGFVSFAYFTGPPFRVCGKPSAIHCGIGVPIR